MIFYDAETETFKVVPLGDRQPAADELRNLSDAAVNLLAGTIARTIFAMTRGGE